MNEIQSDNKFVIRRAAEEDAEALVVYLNKIGGESDYLTFGEGEIGIDADQEREFIKNALNKQNSLLLVVVIDGKIVGNLNFTGGIRQRNFHTGEFGVSVLREYWGRGIGEQLIKYLINWSKKSGIRKINLRVRTDNTRGIKLYKKLGFIEQGVIRRDFFINDTFYDSLSMGLLID